MALLVQKYGGTSVADAERIRHVAERIVACREAGNQVAVVVSAMGDTTDELIELAHSIAANPDPRELDLLLSTGELVSCTLLAMALRELGADAVSMNAAQAGIRTDTAHGRASIVALDPKRVRRELDRGRIVIIAGFQGTTEDMDVTTLGRGGSDTTAVALAAALEAERCEVYTDVSGIYTADPRVVPDARQLSEIGYEEMLELASYGAKMNPRSIEIGMVYNVPILVASSFTDRPGTLIHRGADMNANVGEIRNRVRGIATDTNVAKITMLGVKDRPGIAASLFEPLAQVGVSVDTIVQNTSVDKTTDISFTVSRPDLPGALREVERVVEELGAAGLVSDSGLASVSIVGSGMQNSPGYASRMFRILADGDVNIDMITTSEIRISCVIQEAQVAEAVRLLHRGFELDEEA